MSKKLFAAEDFNFKTEFNSTISNITIRVEWDTLNQDIYIPIDIQCGLLDGWGRCMELIDCDTTSTMTKSVVHMGDDLDHEEAEINYEEINIKLSDIENFLEGFVITVFSNPPVNDDGEPDEKYKNIKLNNCNAYLINTDTDDEICKFELGAVDLSDETIIMCAVLKTENGWNFKALGYGIYAETNEDIRDEIEDLKLGRLKKKDLVTTYFQMFKGLELKYKLMQVAIWIFFALAIFYNIYRFIK